MCSIYHILGLPCASISATQWRTQLYNGWSSFQSIQWVLLTNTMNHTSSWFYLDTAHGPITADIMNRHVGDLGNVVSDSTGTININIQDSIIQLYNGQQSIINRTIVLHAMRDDGGMSGAADSSTTGYEFYHLFFCWLFFVRNAGARIACGNIMLSWRRPMHNN